MRRLTFSFVAALLLAGTLSRPAVAEGIKEYRDCMSFTTRWCDAAREEVKNFIEYQAVESTCALMYIGCTGAIL